MGDAGLFYFCSLIHTDAGIVFFFLWIFCAICMCLQLGHDCSYMYGKVAMFGKTLLSMYIHDYAIWFGRNFLEQCCQKCHPQVWIELI